MAFVNQQYRWCSGTMSLLGDPKFWKSSIPLYTRLCYLSGCVGYIYTAIFTFVAPLLAVGMLIFAPGYLLLKNIIFIAPVLFYAGVIYPMWHRSPYRLEAWSVRMLSGWAHAFAFFDQLRGNVRGWQASGSGARQDGQAPLGWSHRLEFRHVGAVGVPGPVADDDDERLQLLPDLRARAVPVRGRRPDPHPAQGA